MGFWDNIEQKLNQRIFNKEWSTVFSWPELSHTTIVGGPIKQEYEVVKNTKYDPLINNFVNKLQYQSNYLWSDRELHLIKSNLQHQAFRLWTYEDISKTNIESIRSVYEIGGGIGMMHVLLKLINPNIKYYVNDISPMLQIQQYVYRLLFMKERELCLDKLPELMIALWSLSEIEDMLIRNKLNLKCQNYLLAYQRNFHGIIDNVKWIHDNIISKNSQLAWVHRDKYSIGYQE